MATASVSDLSPPSPPPERAVLVAAARHLLSRATSAAESAESRLHCALAICNTSGAKDLPEEVRCRAHVAAGTLLHERDGHQAWAVSHLRSAMQACGRQCHWDWDCFLETVSAALRISQTLLRHGMLKEVKALHECLKGVLQQEASGHNPMPTQRPDGSREAVQWLSAHCSALNVSLLVHEGQFNAAARALTSARDATLALPTEATSVAGLASFASRDELLSVLSVHSTLILARQGELDQAAAGLQELLAASQASIKAMTHAAHDATRVRMKLCEGRVLAATMSIARLDFSTAFVTFHELHRTLHAAPATALDMSAPVPPPRSPIGKSVWLVLVAQLALAVEDKPVAIGLLREARAADAASALPSAALGLWCELLLLLLEETRPAVLRDALSRLVQAEKARPLRLLRSAVYYAQGLTALALEQPAEAERLLARCVKHTIGDSRCDGLTASALAAMAAASRAGGAGGDGGDGLPERERKRRRAEDSLSSALIIAARMADDGIKRRTLDGFAKHYRALGEKEQQLEFEQMLSTHTEEHEAKLARTRASEEYAALLRMGPPSEACYP